MDPQSTLPVDAASRGGLEGIRITRKLVETLEDIEAHGVEILQITVTVNLPRCELVQGLGRKGELTQSRRTPPEPCF